MKAKFLKIAGVKSEKEFYKKYPTEAAFFKAHPEAKKQVAAQKVSTAQRGINVNLPKYSGKEDKAFGVDPYMFGFNPERGVNIHGIGARGYLNILNSEKNKLGLTGDVNTVSVGHPGGVQLFGKPQFSPGITFKHTFESGGSLFGYPEDNTEIGSYIGGEEDIVETGSSPITFADMQNQATSFVTGQDPMMVQYSDLLGDNSASEIAESLKSAGENYDEAMAERKEKELKEKQESNAKKGRKIKKAMAGGFGGFVDNMGGAQGLAGSVTEIVQGIKKIGEQKKAVRAADQAARVSDVAAQAAATRPEIPTRKYVRPEDMLTNPNERFMSYGTGTNILSAEEGAEIGGNPTEIQNMYSPGTIYLDLGFEPLMESDKVKNYQRGGKMSIAQGGTQQPINMQLPLNMQNMTVGAPYIWQSLNSNFPVGANLPATNTNVNTNKSKSKGSSNNNAAGFDMATFSKEGGRDIAGSIAGAVPGVGEDAGSDIGGGLGSAIGGIFGPVGSMVGKFAGKVIGGMLDRSDDKIKTFNKKRQANVENMALQQGAQAIQGQLSGFVRNGGNIPTGEYGWVSHDWQPQVITKFGDYDVEDLLKPDPTMDTLRTGGNLRQNNMGPQDQLSFGGEMKTHWGGYAEPISYNPYLPGTGETVMFRGQSHDESDGKGRTGIGVSYGDTGNDDYTDYAEYGTEAAENKADVEVERNEPAIETQDANGEKSMLVYGNLKIPKQFAAQIGDPRLDHKNLPKFKNYVAKLSKEEEKANNRIARSVEIANNIKPVTSFDKLALETQQTIIDANNLKLKQTAQYKMNAAALQQAINDTGEELGVDADALAKGKIKAAKIEDVAEDGKLIPKGQLGIDVWLKDNNMPYGFSERKKLAEQYGIKNFRGTPAQNEELLNILKSGTKPGQTKTKTFDPVAARKNAEKAINSMSKDQRESLAVMQGVTNYNGSKAKNKELIDKIVAGQEGSLKQFEDFRTKQRENLKEINLKGKKKLDEDFYKRQREYREKNKKESPADRAYREYVERREAQKKAREKLTKDAIEAAKSLSSQISPFLNDPYSQDLDPSQILGELTALGTNQLQPVQAQSYQPDLAVPMGDVSLQDQLNANQADFNALQRIVGYNPEALSQLAAQKYTANQKTLADQFRLNQELKNQVFNKNRDTLNDARLKNLAIYDQQYTRQEQARSNTKATFQEAMSSIASKVLQNQSENRTLAAYSNLFPQYGFDSSMRATSRGLTFFDMPERVGTEEEEEENTTTGSTTTATPKTKKHGGKTKKHFANSSILKMYKG